MKTFLVTAACVFAGIWLWSKFAAQPKSKAAKVDKTTPVDTGMFFGPYIDTKTGAYLAPGDTPGAVQFNAQPGIGLQ